MLGLGFSIGSSGLEQVDGVADGEEHVAAVRGSNVTVDGISAGTSVEVAVPGANPTGLTVEALLQLVNVGLSDVGQVTALVFAKLGSLVVGHLLVTNNETSHSLTRKKSEEGADNEGLEGHLFMVRRGVMGLLKGMAFVCLHAFPNRKSTNFLFGTYCKRME